MTLKTFADVFECRVFKGNLYFELWVYPHEHLFNNPDNWGLEEHYMGLFHSRESAESEGNRLLSCDLSERVELTSGRWIQCN